MTQETEKEDPRQAPPKQYGNTQPGQNVGGHGKAGGMHDDLEASRGARDSDDDDHSAPGQKSAESGSGTGSQSGKDSPQQGGGGTQQGAEKTGGKDEKDRNRESSRGSSGGQERGRGGSNANKR
jgi:hypothetical protein